MTTKHEKYHFSVFLLITHGIIKKIGTEKFLKIAPSAWAGFEEDRCKSR